VTRLITQEEFVKNFASIGNGDYFDGFTV